MKSTKQLGIWMDHSIANLIELVNETMETKTLKSIPAFPDRVENLRLDESRMNNKESDRLSDFYTNLSDVIKQYNEVLLFGPTNAKTELFNVLKDNRQFEKIKIEVMPADKLTENQQEAFVKDFFKTHRKIKK